MCFLQHVGGNAFTDRADRPTGSRAVRSREQKTVAGGGDELILRRRLGTIGSPPLTASRRLRGRAPSYREGGSLARRDPRLPVRICAELRQRRPASRDHQPPGTACHPRVCARDRSACAAGSGHPRVPQPRPRDVTRHLGIPTTTGTRTVWDLATVLSPTGLRRAFEQAEKLRVLDRERLRALLAASPSRKGAGLIRRLLAETALPLGETRSRLEELILELCRDEGVPLPAVNVPLLGWEVDFLWEREWFVVEADGGDHLQPAAARPRQRARRGARAGRLSGPSLWVGAGTRAPSGSDRDRSDSRRARRVARCWDTRPELWRYRSRRDQWPTLSASPTTAPARPTRSTSPTGRSRRWTSARSRSTEDDFGLMTYDPGVHEHRVVPLRDHLHRRRGRDPPAPRLPDRGALRAVHLPRGRLPAGLRRAADRAAARALGLRRHPPHLRPREHQDVHRRASATTRTRWGCCSPASARCRPSTRTPRRSTTPRSATWQAIRLIAKMPTLAAFAYRHSIGLPYVYPDNELDYSATSSR